VANGRPDCPPGAGHCHESGEQYCLLCALQIGLAGLVSGSRLALAPIVLPPTLDWRSLSTEFALPPRSPSRPDRYAADACARHPSRGRTGPDFSCSRASRLVSVLSPAPPPFSRAALRPTAIAGLLPCPLGLRAVHLLRHPFRWPLLSPTAIWDLKCLVSLSRQSALSTPIIDKTSLLSSPSFLR
jgi:hypothetical protein